MGYGLVLIRRHVSSTFLASMNTKSSAEGVDVSGVVKALLPLYTDTSVDRPDSILGSHPKSAKVVQALKILLDVMFPGKLSIGTFTFETLDAHLAKSLTEAAAILETEIGYAIPFRWVGEAARKEGKLPCKDAAEESRKIVAAFLARLPGVRKMLVEDVRAAYEGDPAALTYAEVQIAYPGLLAVASHRIAHELYVLDVPVIPRIMSEWTHSKTGVDIHPGATVGHGFFIDHATGVVIGETTVIGNRVKIYQGVTLGARSFPLDEHGNPIKHIKRHPTVEDDVVIYANATILGGNTVIGKGSTIGGNVFLTESVLPHTVVSANHPELRIKSREEQTSFDWVI